jgi:putative molybdopterin biosynthesis protein
MPDMRIQIEPAWRFRNAEGREIDPLLFRCWPPCSAAAS